ncbi:hypothetical protein [Streptomyces sp. DSM 40750]|nr:hypothetical protein [Streptomyces sp. DSM 40750]UUU19982.1 hypothetical protein JIX55_06505 [Streptomyces sp. DSM 40750]
MASLQEAGTGVDVVPDGRLRQTADTEHLFKAYEMSSGDTTTPSLRPV